MARKTYTTTVDEQLIQRFRTKCKEDGVAMNEMLELFIKQYLDNKVVVIKNINLETVQGD